MIGLVDEHLTLLRLGEAHEHRRESISAVLYDIAVQIIAFGIVCLGIHRLPGVVVELPVGGGGQELDHGRIVRDRLRRNRLGLDDVDHQSVLSGRGGQLDLEGAESRRGNSRINERVVGVVSDDAVHQIPRPHVVRDRVLGVSIVTEHPDECRRSDALDIGGHIGGQLAPVIGVVLMIERVVDVVIDDGHVQAVIVHDHVL